MLMLDNHKISIPALAIVVSLIGCGKKTVSPLPSPQAAPVAAASAPVIEEPKEKPVYVYTGDRFKDPFTQAGASSNYQTESIFDPQRSSVKAIIYSGSFKTA